MMRRRLIATAPYAALVALNILFRLPHLLNAAGVHSDAAIVGLQAMHILNGETSRFLWGLGHQGAVEAWVAAAFFAIGGPSPLMLMLAPLSGHLVLCCVVLALLNRLLPSRTAAFLACLPLVFTPQAINGIVMYSPRQWSITFALCGAMLVAWPARRTPLRLAAGVALSVFSLWLDLFCVLWMPAVALLSWLVSLEPPRSGKPIALRLAAVAAGAAIGILLVAALRMGAPGRLATFDFGPEFVERNWPLMRDTTLPWLLGARTWIQADNLYPDPWQPPAWVAALQWIGAASAPLLVLASVVLAFSARVRRETARLVWFGVTAIVTTLGGYLFSNWPGDMWSTRYLTPIIWSLPFALAALASAVRPRVLGLLLAPYLSVAALGGWLSHGNYVNGLLPRVDPRGSARDEAYLGEYLRLRGYEHGYAQYWLAYRLTFLWRERPTIAPTRTNRYRPYSEAADRAKKRAYIFHPSEPREQPEDWLAELRKRPGQIEVVQVAGFTVILFDEPATPGTSPASKPLN
jgi:hypothetical protein